MAVEIWDGERAGKGMRRELRWGCRSNQKRFRAFFKWCLLTRATSHLIFNIKIILNCQKIAWKSHLSDNFCRACQMKWSTKYLDFKQMSSCKPTRRVQKLRAETYSMKVGWTKERTETLMGGRSDGSTRLHIDALLCVSMCFFALENLNASLLMDAFDTWKKLSCEFHSTRL